MKRVLGFAIILLLSGCAGMNYNSGFLPAGAIVMQEQDQIEVSASTNRTVSGQKLSDFYCDNSYMVCTTYASRKYCTCQTGEIRLPASMGF